MCPGHILLFGHVNILFSSLLSKSLTIKGREARPGRERARAGMPRYTRTRQASAAAASSSAVDDDCKVVDGENREEPTEPTELQKSRPAWQEFSRNMYGAALAQLEEHLERMKTEGVGDCWLLSILAGFEVKDPELVAGLNPQQREEICTSRRKDIVSWAADWKRNGGFRFLCDQFGVINP